MQEALLQQLAWGLARANPSILQPTPDPIPARQVSAGQLSSCPQTHCSHAQALGSVSAMSAVKSRRSSFGKHEVRQVVRSVWLVVVLDWLSHYDSQVRKTGLFVPNEMYKRKSDGLVVRIIRGKDTPGGAVLGFPMQPQTFAPGVDGWIYERGLSELPWFTCWGLIHCCPSHDRRANLCKL